MNFSRDNAMKIPTLFACLFKIFIGAMIFIVPLGCASQIQTMYFGFEYDMRRDGQNAVVLDYRLVADAKSLIAADRAFIAQYGGMSSESIHKQGQLPTDFYVRWMNTKTHIEYDRSVDLRGKLPINIDNCTFYFMVVNDHLQIYLATQSTRSSDQAPIGPSLLKERAVTLIYSN
jgi:hypothetical protein